MQMFDSLTTSECRSRGECRRGDAETRGRAEAETKPEEQSSEKSSAEREESRDSKAEVQTRRTKTRRKGAEVLTLKPAEFRAELCPLNSLGGALLYRERAEKSARGADRHADATKERHTSSASNAAHTSSSRA